ncbi:sulfatase-like hydrolase/transferase [Paraferrimonas sp. SM1919]|uniref:sulfatase-like hydrolase/transferase n=1 Tax=Paraferrimonas sp. SM1919 TaxID=2662263 RepID=UPI0013D7E070|nr:sulfatase-like hydrolase/transferase [Paraferrimonas sp. SM1919]
MWKKILFVFVGFIVIASTLVWFNRIEILLHLATERSQQRQIAGNQDIRWQSGDAIQSDQPNIVMIVMDDMGINDVSTYGGGMIPTPNIDKLAAQGAIFTNGYSAHANCAPARAAMMTGRDSTRTGYDVTPTPKNMGRMIVTIANSDLRDRPKAIYYPEADKANPDFENRGLPGQELTIAEVLKKAGYRTLHIGKWHLGRNQTMNPNAQGFDESLMMGSGLYLPIEHPEAVNGFVDSSAIDRFLWAGMNYAVVWNNGPWFEPKGYLTDYFSNQAERAIEANSNRPFFLYLAHWGPHNPIQATRSDYQAVGDITPHHKRVYAAMLYSLDRSVGNIMAKLEQQGLSENTIVVLTSDNGGADYVAIDDLNKPYRGWKNTFFEGGIRVPYTIRWPGKIAPGTTIDEPVIHYDLMPTLAAAAGVDLPSDRDYDGVDLAPLWSQDDKAFTRNNDAMFWSTGSYRAVQQSGWKLQLNPASGQEFLYNLNVDPTEKNNLIATETDKLASLRSLIDEHFANAVEPVAQSILLAPVSIDKSGEKWFEQDDEYIMWNN